MMNLTEISSLSPGRRKRACAPTGAAQIGLSVLKAGTSLPNKASVFFRLERLFDASGLSRPCQAGSGEDVPSAAVLSALIQVMKTPGAVDSTGLGASASAVPPVAVDVPFEIVTLAPRLA